MRLQQRGGLYSYYKETKGRLYSYYKETKNENFRKVIARKFSEVTQPYNSKCYENVREYIYW